MRVLTPEAVQYLSNMELGLCAHEEPTVPTELVREWMDGLVRRLGPLPPPAPQGAMAQRLRELVLELVDAEVSALDRARELRAQADSYPEKSADHRFLDVQAQTTAARASALMFAREKVAALARRPT